MEDSQEREREIRVCILMGGLCLKSKAHCCPSRESLVLYIDVDGVSSISHQLFTEFSG